MNDKAQIGGLIIRVAIGVIYLMNGIQKFQNLSGTGAFFESNGLPAFMATVIALLETVGGIALIVGLGTRIFGSLFAIEMIVAIFAVKLSMGLVGGYALDLALLASALHLAINGSTLYAVDTMIGRSGASVRKTRARTRQTNKQIVLQQTVPASCCTVFVFWGN
ncbi:DoxX family protein [Cohnella kolymensis]|uniref:DoxX family protein n=1 Tax=Cohnella kolymensis TaxID=1590652 RepID=UPI0009E26A54|nr:DoxX family protein [Cohnella kolymensis]